MTENQIHRATSKDGTEIIGNVTGQGPPLIFVHGMMDDGSLTWTSTAPRLADRFSCHVISLRNRGGSGRSDDQSPPRLIEDIQAYARSLGEPVGLVGLSLGGGLVLGAAAGLDDVVGVVAYEPGAMEAISEEDKKRLMGTVMREAETAKQGRLSEAVRIFAQMVANEQEIASLEAAGAFETMGQNVGADLAVAMQSATYAGPAPTDASVLSKITAPVLLLQAGRSQFRSWLHASIHHVAEHTPNAAIHELEHLGHLAPFVDPEPVAAEIGRFFEQVHATPARKLNA